MLLSKVLLFTDVILLIVAVSAISNGQTPSDMDSVAKSYVKLVLATGQHDADYVDAYYGPPEWQKEAESKKMTLAEIDQEAAKLIEMLKSTPEESKDELVALRREYLERMLQSMRAKISMLNGKKMTFDEESKALYDAVAPTKSEAEFQKVIDQLNQALPGEGSLSSRYEKFQQNFIIPPDKLDAVFNAAIKECRSRTLRHVTLPKEESFTLEYVKNKPWSGYNWYKGNYHSVIQINTDLPIYIDRAVDLAGHEGYPGHHVYNVLLEKNLVHDRGWVDFSVYPLFSPQSLIAEGTANFGVKVEFSEEERLAFEKNVLFPLAGLDTSEVTTYYNIKKLVDQLSYAGNEAARRYLNGEIDAKAAAEFLTKYAMSTPERAAQRVRFMDKYRSYVINYNLGQDLVKQYIEAHGGTPDHPEKRWEVFSQLLSSPRLPSGLN
jgi:ElaB/YqjD/DUF883 family membrane-anchored ribosome-binding protein